MTFRCTHCGFSSGKWIGFCPQCRAPEPLEETAETPITRGPLPEPVPLSGAGTASLPRIETGIGEVDRVLGGGVVPGSVVLLGGEPGVGKSTLLLQAAGALAGRGGRVLVASAEESAQQVGLRAERLGVGADNVALVADDDVDRIIGSAVRWVPDLLVIDSIQAVTAGDLSGSAGGVAQVRESASRIIRYAKREGVATMLVGHVTKDGGLAGPKTLEHMVDVVLSLDGDPDRGLRALRSLKNRFGATHVVGVFDMAGVGLVEVPDPSSAFLAEWHHEVPGTLVFPAIEGRRSVLVEVQALAAPTSMPQPRRSVRGLEVARVHQVLAVLERHVRLPLAGLEIFVNVVGGWRLSEPAADLAVALAVASSALDIPLGKVAAWGEVGLAGEVRPVPHQDRRKEEAERFGLQAIIAPLQGGVRLGEALGTAGMLGEIGRGRPVT